MVADTLKLYLRTPAYFVVQQIGRTCCSDIHYVRMQFIPGVLHVATDGHGRYTCIGHVAILRTVAQPIFAGDIIAFLFLAIKSGGLQT